MARAIKFQQGVPPYNGGEQITVPDAAAAELVKRGLATYVSPLAGDPTDIHTLRQHESISLGAQMLQMTVLGPGAAQASAATHGAHNRY